MATHLGNSATTLCLCLVNSYVSETNNCLGRTNIPLLARVITPAPHHTSATELRWQLHWLPICQQVNFKLSTITCGAVHTSVLSYMASEMHHHQSLRALRCGATTVLHRPNASLDFHRHSFTVSALAVWNNIPTAVCDSVSLDTFKSAFKTHLCNCAYKPRHLTVIHWYLQFTFSDIRRRPNKSI